MAVPRRVGQPMICIIHTWGRWSEVRDHYYRLLGTRVFERTTQQRVCRNCGTTQERDL